MIWRKILICSMILFIVIFLAVVGSAQNDFRVDSIFIKTSIKEGGSYNERIRITNDGSKVKHFNIDFEDLEELVSVDKTEFDVDSGETSILEVNFKDSDLKKGVYVGALNIRSESEVRHLPIIVELESVDVLFDANVAIYPNTKISPGDRITAEVKIFDLSKVGSASVEMTYFIKDFRDNTIISEKESVVVKDKVSITKAIILPEGINLEEHIFGVIIKYKESIGTSSTFFRIQEKEKEFAGISVAYFIIFLGLIFILFLLFIFYSIYSRDKLLDELKSQYDVELRKQRGGLKKEEEKVEKKLKTKKEKVVSKRLFRKVEKERERVIKKVHKERVKEVKKLRKAKKKDKLKNEIAKWKKQGYNTAILEAKVKTPTVNDIKDQIGEWKKKGYNTKVLEK